MLVFTKFYHSISSIDIAKSNANRAEQEADAFRIAAVDPVAMRVHTVRREKNAVFLDEKEITAWNLFKRAKYLGAMRGNKFVPPEMSRETPLKSMYE